MSLSCPINFGDCPDCEHYQAGECQYKDKPFPSPCKSCEHENPSNYAEEEAEE